MSMKRDLYKGARRTAVRRRLTAVLAAAGLLAAPAAFPAAVPAAADRLVTGPAASDAKDDLSAAVSAADDTASVPAAGGAETAKWAVYLYLVPLMYLFTKRRWFEDRAAAAQGRSAG